MAIVGIVILLLLHRLPGILLLHHYLFIIFVYHRGGRPQDAN